MNPDVRCNEGIRGGSASITVGAGTQQEQQQEAEDLALVLRTGALPISPRGGDVQQTVSPTLGADSLQVGLLAGLIGLFLVGIWLFFYRWLGVVALSALGVFGVLVISLISLLGERSASR
jgi:preprotein translocase subunit SecD